MSKVDIKDNSDMILNFLTQAEEECLSVLGAVASDHAKDASPVDTGRLRNSITFQLSSNEKKVSIGTNVEYAEIVESRKAFLKPAISNHSSEYSEIIKSILNK